LIREGPADEPTVSGRCRRRFVDLQVRAIKASRERTIR
jgi:hypothetical protein